MIHKTALLAVAVALAAAGVSLAQDKPDFSGTWVLNMEKSNLGAGRPVTVPGGRTVTLVVKQTAAEMSIERQTGTQKDTAVYKLDGSECTNKLPGGSEVKSTTTWSGATLATKSKAIINAPTGPITSEISDVRSLSADGQVMTIDATRQTAQGEVKQKLVYDKQK